jgi:restriction endonuclease Mrr
VPSPVILTLNFPFFEQVIVELLVAMGYGGSLRNAATQLGRSGDGGVNGVINEDRLGLDRQAVRDNPISWSSRRSGLRR